MTYKRFTSFIEDDGYWIRDESDFKIIATGLKFGVAENLIAMLNGLTAKNKVLHKEIERLKTQNEDILYNNAKNMELLEKENEQLKSKHYWYKQYKELLNENEQLKQQAKYSEIRTALISGWLNTEGNLTLDKYEEILDYCYQEYKKGNCE